MQPSVSYTIRNLESETTIAQATVDYWRNETKVRSMERRSDEFVAKQLVKAIEDLEYLRWLAEVLA